MHNNGIKKLLLKLTLLLLPFAVWPLVEAAVLPINFFTFRVWETLAVNKMEIMSGPFYPNMYIKMKEEGELAPHTPFAKKKVVEWYTDAYGYRNRDSKCDVLLIGDSNITGVKLTQEETLAEVLERQLNKEVYSFAPATMNRFLATSRFQSNPPEVVIVSSIERRIPDLPAVGANGFKSKVRDYTGTLIGSSHVLTHLAVTADRISKLALYRRTLASIDRALGRREYIAYDNQFFIQGDTANRTYSQKEVDQIADVLEGYHDVLQEKGIRFLFLPIPNKENIYYQMLPSRKKPDFLPRLIAELHQRNINVVDTQSTFEHLYQAENQFLFPNDDGHWNDIAVKQAASLVAQQLNETKYNAEQKDKNYLVKYTETK